MTVIYQGKHLASSSKVAAHLYISISNNTASGSSYEHILPLLSQGIHVIGVLTGVIQLGADTGRGAAVVLVHKGIVFRLGGYIGILSSFQSFQRYGTYSVKVLLSFITTFFYFVGRTGSGQIGIIGGLLCFGISQGSLCSCLPLHNGNIQIPGVLGQKNIPFCHLIP